MASASSSSSSSSSSSPCPICLEPLKDEAYLDRCFHAFCYKCISQWLRFVGNKQPQPIFSISCPLCKTENLSIIHGFSGDSFQRHYINQNHRKRYFSNAHEFRLQIYNSEGENRGNISDVQRYWKRRKYLQKNIWLQDWLRREIQTLMQEENTDIIMYHIQGVIESFMRRQQREGLKGTPEHKRKEFKSLLSNAARPFLLSRTERFVNEVELFLVSGLNIDAYDRVCMQRLNMSTSDENRGQDGTTS
ncbi:uncharacterized protein [Typha angustifolia]|uniref:uncharacterized protein isoform X1 n=1 Tax=Typha angustifolia TaxID=59011 RepID=UPI003C30DCA3